MKDWYLRQTPRDRIIVLVVSALSLVGIFYAFIWYPLATGLDNNQTLINSKTDTLQKMQVAGAKLKSLDGASGSDKLDPGGKAPYVLIDERIRAAQINPPDSVTPKGAEGARVQFSKVEFDKLVLVIAELERYGLSVDTLNVTRNPEVSGMVSARFEMEKN